MNEKEIYESVLKSSLSACLSESEINILISKGDAFTIERNRHVFEPYDKSDSIFFLIEGVVKIAYNSDDGREIIKAVLHNHSIFGEHSLTGEERRENYATVMTPEAKILAVETETINELMEGNIKLAKCIINFFGSKLKNSEARLESLFLNDARERIVEFIKINANTFGKQIGFELLLKHTFTQQDIANYTGTSRQTVTTVLNELRKTNKIHFKGKSMLIRNIAALS